MQQLTYDRSLVTYSGSKVQNARLPQCYTAENLLENTESIGNICFNYGYY